MDDLHPAFEWFFLIRFRKFVRFRAQMPGRFRSSSPFWISEILGVASLVAHNDEFIITQIVQCVHPFVCVF